MIFKNRKNKVYECSLYDNALLIITSGQLLTVCNLFGKWRLNSEEKSKKCEVKVQRVEELKSLCV